MKINAKEWRYWLLLAALPLATGASLLVYVFAHISLGLSLLAAAVIVVVVGIFTWRNLTPLARVEIVLRMRAGLLAGFLATLCYDSMRWIMVTVLHFTFWPFEIFPLFGRAIAGAQTAPAIANTIGIIYHYVNGILFAIAYAILLAPRGWWTGILWALGLEALMLLIYPGWLHIQAFNEFLSVSMLGHVTYGTIMGVVSRRYLAFQRTHRHRIESSNA